MPSQPHESAPASHVPATASSHRTALGIGALALVMIYYGIFVIRNFSGPIGDYNESFLHEYLAWYASKHITLWPIPTLHLHTDQVLYPFGANVALQSWCVERDVLFALLKPLFPNAPLLQLYYLLGVGLSTIGSYLLLLPRFGALRSGIATVLAHAFNFYSMQKYAYHFNIACYHWTTLGIVCDFVLVRTVVADRMIPLRLLLLRCLLLALAFGLELGHVLGYSLTSFLFASAYVVWFVRSEQRQGRIAVQQLFHSLRDQLGRDRLFALLMLSSTLAVAWLYGAITFGIVRDSLSVGKFPGQAAAWWASPLRLLIPYTPWLHPSMQPLFNHVLGDLAEDGIGCGSPGLFLLFLAGLGIYQTKAWQRRSPYFFLFASFCLYVLSGAHLPLLKLLPWFAFCRVYSRSTLVYSTLLALFALEVSFSVVRTSIRRSLLLLGILGIGVLELVTVAQIKRELPAYSFSAQQKDYLATIKKLPGEALLDFPFCLTGGNGDIAGLCPLWQRLKGVYALQRFHEKKVIGQYLGRLHPNQTAPFVRQGWDTLNDPDTLRMTIAQRQRRCLTSDEWFFFEQFYLYNDFAGIQLAIDRLPPGCPEQFYKRYGAPIASMELAGAGRLVLIPKPLSQHALVNKEMGKQVTLTRTEAALFKRKLVAADLQVSSPTDVHEITGSEGQPQSYDFVDGDGIVYGPYVALPKGRYVATFELEVPQPGTGTLAKLDVAAHNTSFAATKVQADSLPSGRQTVALPFELSERTSGIETRVCAKGTRFILHSITLEQLGTQNN